MATRASCGWKAGLLIFTAFSLPLSPPVRGSSDASKGEVLVVRSEKWRLCGIVALNPRDPKWNCCRELYPFHRPTQRCCQTQKTAFVIPKNPQKSEFDDCLTYIRDIL